MDWRCDGYQVFLLLGKFFALKIMKTLKKKMWRHFKTKDVQLFLSYTCSASIFNMSPKKIRHFTGRNVNLMNLSCSFLVCWRRCLPGNVWPFQHSIPVLGLEWLCLSGPLTFCWCCKAKLGQYTELGEGCAKLNAVAKMQSRLRTDYSKIIYFETSGVWAVKLHSICWCSFSCFHTVWNKDDRALNTKRKSCFNFFFFYSLKVAHKHAYKSEKIVSVKQLWKLNEMLFWHPKVWTVDCLSYTDIASSFLCQTGWLYIINWRHSTSQNGPGNAVTKMSGSTVHRNRLLVNSHLWVVRSVWKNSLCRNSDTHFYEEKAVCVSCCMVQV